MKAATDPGARDDFYIKLLWSQLHVLVPEKESPFRNGVVEKGTNVKIINLQSGEVPVFTSKNRIFDNGVIKKQVFTMDLRGQDLFELTQGATLFLNPYSGYNKILTPQEIQNLLNGNIFNHVKQIIIDKSTRVLLRRPSPYPTKLTEALSELFAQRFTVTAAYIAEIKMEDDQLPHLLIGLDVSGDYEKILREAGRLAQTHMKESGPIDFIQIGKVGVSQYFTKNPNPFYRRPD